MSSASSAIGVLLLSVAALLMGEALTLENPPRSFFVFGDSLVDNGNNNFLLTTARADAPPYGIDYPTHRATGRFSNGYNLPDLISHELGAESTMAFLDPRLEGKKLLIGANFASAGIGILNDTGFQFANIIRIHQQLHHFQLYQQRVAKLLGEQAMKKLVNKALALISLGGNDFVNNYFLTPITVRRLEYNLNDYCHLLVSEYSKILQGLYDLGARRVIVTGTGPLGCVPGVLASRSRDGQCAAEVQQAAAIFNQLLVDMIAGLNKNVCSKVFVAVNALGLQNDIIGNPQAYGFVTSKVACCGQGPYNGVGLCTDLSNLCSDRDKYAFWDAYHPTERANRILVQKIFTGSNEYMSPMNLSTIMQLDSMADEIGS